MNSKMLLAFVGGLIVASGVTYIAMKREAPVPAEPAKAATAAPVAAAPVKSEPATAEAAPAPAEPEAAAPKDEPKAAPPQPKQKPSPAVRARREAKATKPIQVAQAAPPPAAAAPAPAPAPVQEPQPVPRQEVAKAEPPPSYEAPPPPPPPPPSPHTVTIPLGTTLNVRLGETLSSERNQPGDQFTAVLDQPLVQDGFVIAERGSRARGRIVELERSGKVKGNARLAIELTQLRTSDGQDVRIRTSAFDKQAESSRNKDAAKVGAGAALGAIIGAIAGGGRGAAIGAGAGGAAGAGDVMLTRGRPAELRVETKVAFRLSEALTLTEKLQ